MTSNFEGTQPPQNKAFQFQPKQGAPFGFQVVFHAGFLFGFFEIKLLFV